MMPRRKRDLSNLAKPRWQRFVEAPSEPSPEPKKRGRPRTAKPKPPRVRTVRCLACRHERVAALDDALAAGATYRQLAADFGVGPAVVARHLRLHLSPGIRARRALSKRGESM